MSPHVVTRPHWVNYIYSISQELYSLFTLCCVLLWFGIGQFYSYPSYQDYFTGIGATIRLSRRQCGWSNPENMGKPHKFAADCRYTHNKPKQIKTMYIHMGNVVYIYIYIHGLVQKRRNSIANALELRLSCTSPSICCICKVELHYNTFIFIYNTHNRYH